MNATDISTATPAPATSTPTPPKPAIVLIHGLWMTPLSWEHWIDRFSRAGHEVIAPAWPGMEASVADLRRDPSLIATLTIKRILEHYERIIRDLPTPPVIIGHSFGGTFVQVLLDRGLGRAGIGIDSSTIKGILNLPLSTLRATAPVLSNPLNFRKAVPLTPKQFHYAFTNTLSDAASQAAYARYHVPAAAHVLFEGAFANFIPGSAVTVNVNNNNRAPLLLIAGGKDHVIPPSVTRANVGKYSHSSAITAYKEFPERSHFTVGQDGWEVVADYALNWAMQPSA